MAILEEETKKRFGYYSTDLGLRSKKKIVVSCSKCGKARIIEKGSYSELCNSCVEKGRTISEVTRKKLSESHKGEKAYWYGKHHTEEAKRKMGKAKRGENHPCYGKHLSEVTRRKLSEAQKGEKSSHYGKHLSEEQKSNISNALKGRIFSEEHCRKLRGKYHHAWKGGVSFGKYCPKFNNALKEKIREKYGFKCYFCGKTEEENGRRLDIHHIDKDKMQGCKDKTWFLIPLCISCHAKLHNPKQEKAIKRKIKFYIFKSLFYSKR